MFKSFNSIFTTSMNKKLEWVDEFGNFAIFKTTSSPGSPVAWYLYEISTKFNSDIKHNDCYIWKTEGGNWSRKKFKKALESKQGFLNREFLINSFEYLGWKKKYWRGCYVSIIFQAPNYNYNFRESTEVRINYSKIPLNDKELFEMYPILKRYK